MKDRDNWVVMKNKLGTVFSGRKLLKSNYAFSNSRIGVEYSSKAMTKLGVVVKHESV